ncbi:hypothetical protein SAMD00019534_081210, partial [Acytostelium subglobosum LB1]|uniref:hypothetical protein n=1 Tax=Acytostelium subglobosum LB1 TaxID=1410327 RepID=UPI000644F6EE
MVQGKDNKEVAIDTKKINGGAKITSGGGPSMTKQKTQSASSPAGGSPLIGTKQDNGSGSSGSGSGARRPVVTFEQIRMIREVTGWTSEEDISRAIEECGFDVDKTITYIVEGVISATSGRWEEVGKKEKPKESGVRGASKKDKDGLRADKDGDHRKNKSGDFRSNGKSN